METGSGRGRELRYRGYRSFDYLEPGRDYRRFRLASETDRVPPFVVEVDAAEEDRVWRLLATHPAISLHDHLEVAPDDITESDAQVHDGHMPTGYEGLARSGLAAVFENFGDGTATITSKSGWKWSDVVHDIGMRYADWAHQDFVVRAETIADIRAAFANAKVALIGALEAATPDRERARPDRHPLRLRHPDAGRRLQRVERAGGRLPGAAGTRA